ncbi:hypothetical protein E5358_03385 [Palleniella muris]|uniref:Uncharacterized protein n=1 Tax=Palleniella muris TaxID=3038145 RepID=A0AC61QS66_9BACT|nr:alpha-2-macroglobulin family protein [Palleniella muris]TGX83313.1 hypothetical protein E5358_03385 [Palleniella muris]
MKKITTILFSVFLTITASAGNYDYIWRKYCEAVKKDMYQDAQEQLKKIEKLSEDDPVLAAVYNTIRKDYDKALSNPDLLAKEKSTPWNQIINKGEDDKLWNYDLLSIIGHQAGRYEFLKHYYDSIGNHSAACAELYFQVQNINTFEDDFSLSTRRKLLKDGIAKYKNVEEVALLEQAYYATMLRDDDISNKSRYDYLQKKIAEYAGNKYVNFFKNRLADLTNPQFGMKLGEKLTLQNVRNIGKLTIEFLPMNCDGKLSLSTNRKEDLPKILKLASGSSARTISRDYSSHKPWEVANDTLDRPQLHIGVYLVKVSSGKLTTYDVLYNSDITVLSLPIDQEKQRFVAVSTTTGKAIPSCSIVITKERNSKTEKTLSLVTDAKGEVVCKTDFQPNRIYAYTTTDKAFRKKNYHNYFSYYTHKEDKDILTVFTDRAVYRPGQTIKGSIVAHNAYNTDSVHVIAGKQVNITINDTDHKEIYTDSVITDAHGNAGFEFALPKSVEKNGHFTIFAKTNNSVHSSATVFVEEYKRPTFEVNAVDDKSLYANPDSTYRHGDSISVAFEAKTFTQMPVANADVEYTIQRRTGFYRWGRQRIVANNVKTVTDSNGKIVIPLNISLPEEGWGTYVYDITAKVTSKDGESREARTSVRASVAKNGKIVPLYAPNNGSDKEELVKFNVSSEEFPHKGNVVFTVSDSASTEPLHVYYSLFADKKCLLHDRFTVKGAYKKAFTYKKEYGENLIIKCVAIRDGKTYTYTQSIKRPQPDLKLTPTWTTFRDRTQPGAMETWSLRITGGKDKNTPAGSASLIATVFDKSLDLVAKHSWGIDVIRNSFSLYNNWSAHNTTSLWCSKSATYKSLTENYINYGSFKPELLYYAEEEMALMPNAAGGIRIRGARPLMMAAAKQAARNAYDSADPKAVGTFNVTESSAEDSGYDTTEELGEVKDAENLSTLVRTDLGETAYFTPSLVADKDGNLTMSFRMPETMTTWRFMGFVHDDKMRHAFIDTTCVAQKAIIVKPNIPRFLREGEKKNADQPVFMATVSNTTDKDINANVTMQLLAADAETVLWEKKTVVTVKAKGSEAVSLDAPAVTRNDSVLVYRIVAADADGSSDGEQQFIPVLPAVEETISTIAFMQRGDSVFTTNIKDLLINGSTDRKMTVRYTANAERVVLDAIPHITRPAHKDALSLATAVYVGTMYPAQTPDSLLTSVTKELAEMQLSDGSWSWWKGMCGSPYITASIAKYFARLRSKYIATAETDKMLEKAMPYLFERLGKEVERLKKFKSAKGVHPSELATEILYICALQKDNGKTFGSKAEADIKYLVNLLEKIPAEFTIYGKAQSAVILSRYGKRAKAKEFIESMRQYSVYTPEAGRYYDTRKAHYSWRNYKIPTEVAAIEALRIVCPEDKQTVEEMQQWLLHEKRTQQWDNSANTADAVWAFMSGNNDIEMNRDIAYKLTIGGKEVKDGDIIDIQPGQTAFSASKDSKGTAWGGLLVTQRAPLSSVKTRGTCFSVKREIVGDKNPAVGDKVIVRITVNADRDYDFVKVTDNRAACLEPVQQLSGYQSAKTDGTARGSWSGYYRETKDNMTNYYFDSMAKGTHIIETEYFVDREGRYRQGTCTVSCAYAPEFSAVEAPAVVETKGGTVK